MAEAAPEAIGATEPTLAEKEAAYEKFVWANLKRNYIGHYLHGMLGMTGFRLINAPTFLPAYLHMLSGSNTIVGLGLALQQLGGVLSPIVGANQVEHRTKVMPAALWMGGLARLQIIGMALAGWFLSGQSRVVAIIGFMFLFGLFMGTQRVVFSMLLAKVIPISRRGRLQAWRNATGGLIAAGLAYLAGRYFIDANLFGNGYSTTFIFAFALTSLGLTALRLLMIEPEPPTVRARSRLIDRFKDFPALLAEKGFLYFMIVQMLAITARMAVPFYVLFASSTIELNGKNLGLLSLAFLGADTISNLVWGYLGDKTGFRLIMLISLLLWVGSTVLLMGAHDFLPIFLAFSGLGAAQSGYMMSAGTMILEFGDRDEMPMRIAFSATAEGIMGSIGPLLGGVISSTLGYGPMFSISIAFLIAALIVLITLVKEPRTARHS
ncbi:MFS transporter [Phenylobacterium sp.]|uniref:MFS transporter n=1 Tax=Phenylobacterium sp. TaxID=1871053 RepID=UPI00273018C3|nr:MFS transporter [Phenylobacterium sp.]MDP1597621.1 MFS transporter [Phenylobacterium sp.]MDP3592968.1 MFS transporter [Phenylobacterium sp.]